MTDTSTLDDERRKIWWTTEQRPQEASDTAWTHCCSDADLTSDPLAFAQHIVGKHSVRAEVVYRTRVYDNPTRTGEPLAVAYIPAGSAPELAADPQLVNVVSASGPTDVYPEDHPDHPDHPESQPQRPITSLEDLFRHMHQVVSTPGYDPAMGYQSPPLRLDVSDMPEGVRGELGALLKSMGRPGIQDAKGAAEQTLIAASARFGALLAGMQKNAKADRDATDWYQHSDMLAAAAAQAAAFLSAYLDWSTQS